MGTNKAISVGTGVFVQDEGDVPSVQVSLGHSKSARGTVMDDQENCPLQFFVNGVQRALEDGTGSTDVELIIASNGKRIEIVYPLTELKVVLGFQNCRLGKLCVTLPDTDTTVGVLGTLNDDVSDEWTRPDGTIMTVPEDKANKLKKPGYDFCTQNYCIRDEIDSNFVYNEAGITFDTFQRCDLPYGDTLEKMITEAPQWVLDLCAGDAACIMDVQNGGAEDAATLRAAALEFAGSCSVSGGDCDDVECCDGLECIDNGGVAGKVCDGDLQVSANRPFSFNSSLSEFVTHLCFSSVRSLVWFLCCWRTGMLRWYDLY